MSMQLFWMQAALSTGTVDEQASACSGPVAAWLQE